MSAINPADYYFTAQFANARNPDGKSFAEKYVVLDIRQYDDQASKAISGIWKRMQAAVANYHTYAEEDGQVPNWSEWDVLNWLDKKEPQNRQKFIAWDGDVIAGFVTLRADFPAQHTQGQRALYVEHLGAAPGNMRTALWCRRLKHVGRSLFAYAAMQSIEQGHGGLLGLHVADEAAAKFYETLNQFCGGLLFQKDSLTGIVAPTPRGDPRAAERQYYETIPSGAIVLLDKYRRPTVTGG